MYGVISRIAAWRIEQPKEEVHYDQLFGKHLAQLRDSYYEKKKKQIQKLAEKMLDLLHGAESTLEPDERRDAAAMLARLKERFGYCDLCARDATAFLLKRRYQ